VNAHQKADLDPASTHPRTEVPASKRQLVLIAISGLSNFPSVAIHSLVAHAYSNELVRQTWEIHTIHQLGASFQGLSTFKDLVRAVEQVSPELIGFSCYVWNLAKFRQLSRMLRKSLPLARFLWGGPEIDHGRLVTGELDSLDMAYAVFGEGERPFMELLLTLSTGTPELTAISGLAFRNNGKGRLTINSESTYTDRTLDLPSAYLKGAMQPELFTTSRFTALVETQRGCSFRCAYCFVGCHRPFIAYFDLDRVVDEIRFLKSRGVASITFSDPNFTSDLGRAKELVRRLITEGLTTSINVQLIPGFLDEELVRLFAQFNRAGGAGRVVAAVGIQSIHEKTLRTIHRPTNRDRIERTLRLLLDGGIFIKADVMIGLPGETAGDVASTLDYFIERFGSSHQHLLCCHQLIRLPGTELYDLAAQHGMVFQRSYEEEVFFESPEMPRVDVLRTLRRTAVVFRLLNHRGWSSKEFLSGASFGPEDHRVRDSFFRTRERRRLSNIELVDLLVDALLERLKDSGSLFTAPDFPLAEHWWWQRSPIEVSHEWLVDRLDRI